MTDPDQHAAGPGSALPSRGGRREWTWNANYIAEPPPPSRETTGAPAASPGEPPASSSSSKGKGKKDKGKGKGKGKGGGDADAAATKGSARDSARAAEAAGEGRRGDKVLEDVWSWLEPVSSLTLASPR